MPQQQSPAWKRAFDAAEKFIGPRVEAAVRTEQFAETASALVKLQRRSRTQLEEARQQAMHAWNVPTALDVRRLSNQLAELDRHLRELSRKVDALAEAAAAADARHDDPAPQRGSRTQAEARDSTAKPPRTARATARGATGAGDSTGVTRTTRRGGADAESARQSRRPRQTPPA